MQNTGMSSPPHANDSTSPASRPQRIAMPLGKVIERQEMGLRLRAERKHRGLTLRAVAERSGVSLPTLSKMELGQVSISYDKFVAVARALGIDIAQFFGPGAPDEPGAEDGQAPTFTRSAIEQAPNYRSDQYDHHMLAVDFPQKKMIPAYSRIRARTLAEFPDYNRHPGQEFLLVLAGALRVCFENGEDVTLGATESVYFDSSVGHVYLSTSDVDAQVLIVMTDA
ncbi:MAG: hypothetical protein JWP29_1185 [Rhodoferax sp.]|nr:hypothetical protein [Rhodoferax sp.]